LRGAEPKSFLKGEKIMIPKIKNILYATDLSENSAYAFRYAINSAEKHDAKIQILHVLEKLSPMARSRAGEFITPENLAAMREVTKKELLKEIRSRLEEFCQRELKDKPEMLKRVVSFQVIEGYPAGTILEKAEESKADMLIMGTHSKGALAHAFLGSVAATVLNRIKIPVYVIPIPKKNGIAHS
jgi:nucleotide-binding universal stress UspA family protein